MTVPDETELPPVVSKIEYPYTRTTGPVIGPFLTALRDGTILGSRVGDRVLCPPVEYDPDTGAAVDVDLVEVGPGGVVTSWTWVAEPGRKHPFDHPFAFALIRLDGADTAMVHAVDAGSPEAMATGMRVTARFAAERTGAITDVAFVPEAATEAAAGDAVGDAGQPAIEPGAEPVAITTHLISLDIREPFMPHRARFIRGLQEGRIIGQRSPASGKVYVPGKGYDPLTRTEMTEADDVVVSDRGSVSSFTVITPVQYYGQKETEPYTRASILLDGADSPLTGVDIRDIPVEEFRVGLRLQAVWKPPAQRTLGDLDNRGFSSLDHVIDRWEPTGEPDADPRPLQEYAF
jgi:uncharacterized OB-fold protein